ncbi:MAG TPA: hypothetical protein VKY22_10065 [Bradyrhizobium sp.]|nr:hypothetical protein [Bradyrhizobium sp.]
MDRLARGFSVARIGLVLMASVLAVAISPGEAAAGHVRHLRHHRHHQISCGQVQATQASLTEGAHLGAMRYYGGPKSPMWRDVR